MRLTPEELDDFGALLALALVGARQLGALRSCAGIERVKRDVDLARRHPRGRVRFFEVEMPRDPLGLVQSE